MSEAGTNDAAGADSPSAPDLPPLRPAAPARPSGLGELQHDDPVQIGDYRLIGQLGIGGMGTVYLGQSPDGARVAIKLVHMHLARDARFRARFAGEVRAAQCVPGFCTARVIESGYFEDRPYLVTEYLEGIPLSRLITEDGPLDPATLHSVAIGVAAALAAIHGAGLVHRDLKPSNLMVTLGGVRIIDFGIARVLDVTSDVTGTGNIVGSLGWASPEQLRAEQPRPSMDIFGWGCLVAFAATGRHPFGGADAAARAWRILEGEPDLSGIPDPIRHLVAMAIDRDPNQRPDARQLLLALTVDDMTQPATPSGRRWLRDRRATAMAIAVPIALAMVFALAETTSELMGGPGGVADAGAAGGGDSAIIDIFSPKVDPMSPQVGGRRDRSVPTTGPASVPTPTVTAGTPFRNMVGSESVNPPLSPSPTPATSGPISPPPITDSPPPPSSDPPASIPPTTPVAGQFATVPPGS